MTERSTKDGPFCWQSKPALKRIREAFDELTFLDQALAVYTVLTECASNEQSETFTVRKRRIAELSGVSPRRTSDVLGRLQSIGLLEWKQNRDAQTQELSSNTYRLMSCIPCTTPGTACTTPGTECLSLGKNAKRENCRVVTEESKEESKEESPKKGAIALIVPLVLNSPSFLAEWERWMRFRKKRAKIVEPQEFFQNQLDEILQPLGSERAAAALKYSRDRQYIAIVEDPKPGASSKRPQELIQAQFAKTGEVAKF